MTPRSSILLTASMMAAVVGPALGIDKAPTGTNLADAASWAGAIAPIGGDGTNNPATAAQVNWVAGSSTGGHTVDSAVSWGSLNFTDADAAVSVTGSDITLSGGGQFTNHVRTGAQNVIIANNFIGRQEDPAGTLAAPNVPGNPGRLTFSVAGTGGLTLAGNITQTTDFGGGGGDDLSVFLRGTGTGEGTVDGNITVNHALVKTDSSRWVVNGNISAEFIRVESGTLTLKGTNNLTAARTTMIGGTLQIGNNAALGTTELDLTATSKISSDSATARILANAVNLGSSSTMTFGDATNSGPLTFSSTLTLSGANGTRTISTASDVTFNGALQGSSTQSFTKNGVGTLILNATGTAVIGNTTTGVTVGNGTLLANGTGALGTGTAIVNVSSGAIFGGTGSVIQGVNVTGVLAPGAVNSLESFATGTVSFVNTSTYAYGMANNGSTGADLLAITGALNLGGTVTLSLADTGIWSMGDKLTLISYTGMWNNGLFSFADGNDGFLADGETFTFGSNDWLIDYNDSLKGNNFKSDASGSFVTMTVVPEPAAALFSALGLLALLRHRRN